MDQSSIKMVDKVEFVEIDKLVPYERNAKDHPDYQIEQIIESIKKFGFNNPIKIDEKNMIIAGHARFEAAEKMGLKKIPCERLEHLTELQKREYILADNKLAENALWNHDLLADELISIKELGSDFSGIGFSNEELKGIFEEIEQPENEEDEEENSPDKSDELPEEPKKIWVKEGDLFKLGEHRLLCGDCTKKENIEKLLNSEKIDIVFTDPPYGVDYTGGKGRGKLAKNLLNNVKIKGNESNETAKKAFNICSLIGLTKGVWWGANYYASVLPEISSWIIWDKRKETPSDHNADCELAWCSSKKPARIFRYLWRGCVKDGEHFQKRIHPAQKPVALAEWCFDYFGNPKNILDIFLGSGSTLIACEKTNRKCFGMEIDPYYVQLVIERWEKFTGKFHEKI